MAGPEKVRNWLTKNKHSHEWLADQLGVKRSAVTNWINGYNKPDLESLITLRRMNICIEEDWL